jgi:hypothetical protein
MKVSKIEVVFPIPVEFPPGFLQTLDALVNMICEKYEAENPGRVMWCFGQGAKLIWREPEEPVFDDSIFQIEVAEREASPKELKRKKRRQIAPLIVDLNEVANPQAGMKGKTRCPACDKWVEAEWIIDGKGLWLDFRCDECDLGHLKKPESPTS